MRRAHNSPLVAGTTVVVGLSLACIGAPDDPGERSGSECLPGETCSDSPSALLFEGERAVAVGGVHTVRFRPVDGELVEPFADTDAPDALGVGDVARGFGSDPIDSVIVAGLAPGSGSLEIFTRRVGSNPRLVDWITIRIESATRFGVRPVDRSADSFGIEFPFFDDDAVIYQGATEAISFEPCLRAADGTRLADDGARVLVPASGDLEPPIAAGSVAVTVDALDMQVVTTVPVVASVATLELIPQETVRVIFEDFADVPIVCVVPRDAGGRAIAGVPQHLRFVTADETTESDVSLFRPCPILPAASGLLTITQGGMSATYSVQPVGDGVDVTPVP